MAGTNNSWNNQIAGSYNQIILNAGTNGIAISTDNSAATVNVATGGAVKTATFGSTNSTSATTVQSGSGALAVTSTNGTLTINSGTGALSISSDASATTINIATGAAAKTVTLGSTNSTSLLALKYGTADFTLASATGTVMSALDTGEITTPLQPAFLAVKSATSSNVTGNGTQVTIVADTEIYDQNSDYNNGTGVFTAPVTGKYFLAGRATIIGCTIANSLQLAAVTSNNNFAYNANRPASSNNYDWACSVSGDMDAGDTVSFKILTQGEAADTDDLYGDGTTQGSYVNGWLLG